jgi:hypothetical protein
MLKSEVEKEQVALKEKFMTPSNAINSHSDASVLCYVLFPLY